MYNIRIRNGLKDKDVRSISYGLLATLDGRRIIEFIYAPTTLSFDKSAQYSSNANNNDTGLVAWGGNSPEILNFDLPISGYPDKDINPYIEEIKGLMTPDTKAKSPPALVWKWGKRNFAPCVLTRVSPRETGWYEDGTLYEAVLAIGLLKVSTKYLVNIQ